MSRLLDPDTLAAHLDPLSASTREIVLALRDLVLDAAPGVAEAIKFNSLCYFLEGAPYRSIGGNICMITVREGEVSLAFIQGAGLPDPTGLLTGKVKAKREAPIRSVRELANPAVRDLLRASLAAAEGLASGLSERARARR